MGKRKQEILGAALEIIYKQGYYNLTMRNLAKKVGISEAAIYRHFKSKQAIINMIAERVFPQKVLSSKEVKEKDPFLLLDEIMEAQIETLENNPYFTSIIFQEEIFREYPEVKAKFNKHRQQTEKLIVEIINKGQEKDFFNKEVVADSFAILYMGSIRVTVLKWGSCNFGFSLSAKMNSVKKELFKLLKKE